MDLGKPIKVIRGIPAPIEMPAIPKPIPAPIFTTPEKVPVPIKREAS